MSAETDVIDWITKFLALVFYPFDATLMKCSGFADAIIEHMGAPGRVAVEA